MKIKKTSPKFNKKSITVVGIAVVLLFLGYGAVAWAYNLPPFHTLNSEMDGINFNKSDVEKDAIKRLQDNPSQKTENDQRDKPQEPKVNEAGKRGVSVLITNTSVHNGVIEISGFVSDVSEEGGLCEYVFVKDQSKITRTTSGLPNPTSTTCETVSVPIGELNTGVWTVHIQYSSQYSEGSSLGRDVKL